MGAEQVIVFLQIIGEILLIIVKGIYFAFEALYKQLNPKEASVKGEIILVTGAGHGIGKELALQYAALGATVVIWDINEANMKKTVKEIAEKGYPKAHAYVCDVSKREDVFATVSKVEKDVGDVNIIVNNAGIMPTHSMLEHTQQEIERIFGINVLAHFWIMQAILPSMLRNKHGHIVALSSCAGIFGLENLVPYCASKFAVRGMMEALYAELKMQHKDSNIGITIICPYMVATGLCKKPKVRFENISKQLSPTEVAASIIQAQRTGTVITTFPHYALYGHKLFGLLPRKTVNAIQSFIGVRLESDL